MQCSNFAYPCITSLTASIERPTYVNAMKGMAMLAALENSSIIFTSTCEMLIQTEFNGILRKCFVTWPFEMSLKYRYVRYVVLLVRK